jgi:hypothetical protein
MLSHRHDACVAAEQSLLQQLQAMVHTYVTNGFQEAERQQGAWLQARTAPAAAVVEGIFQIRLTMNGFQASDSCVNACKEVLPACVFAG